MEPQLGDVSDDGYWVLTESGWQATEHQKQALEGGAIPYQADEPQSTNSMDNLQIVTIPTDKSDQFSDRSVWIWRIAAGAVCFIGVVIFLILILGSSAEEKELFGTWENEVDSLEFKENGDLNHQGGLYDGWSVSGSTITFTDSDDPDYEWKYKYQVTGKIMFINGLDEGGDIISGECVVMVKEGHDFYEEYDKVTDPSWCTYE
tara:strand:- start:3891 stop:4502 length:612 start_codon:yes stop_codon:yes gene_type:complete